MDGLLLTMLMPFCLLVVGGWHDFVSFTVSVVSPV